MIIRNLARRPGAIQSFAQRACRTAPFARHEHTVPSLSNHNELESNGIPGLFSKNGFDVAYTQYQGHIVRELNTMTVGTERENKAPQALVVDLARDPQAAYAFNVASMAFNNHFFFRGINSNPDVLSVPSADLHKKINENFTSFDSLKETFLATAEAMFGPGFVWLVQTNDTQRKPLKILTTYLAGTPLSGAHYRRQEVDLNTHNPASYQNLNKAGAFGANAKLKQQPKRSLGGVDVVPLLCVNTWEHAWLTDYGVAGKAQYLQAWWDKIDWDQVRQYADTTRMDQEPQSQSQGPRRFLYN